MQKKAFIIHALSPLHPGAGASADIVDLPVARMKATGIPFLPGSSIKGVLRSSAGSTVEAKEAVFGPSSDNASLYGGALVVGDAKLLALPVRSFRGTFVWTTSPLLLTLATRDMLRPPAVPQVLSAGSAACPKNSVCLQSGKLYLEDLNLNATESSSATEWAELLGPIASPACDIFTKRFAIIDDETMTFLWETATQIDAHVRIDPDTGTAKSGALWLEESLPPETLLIGVLAAEPSHSEGTPMSAEEVLEVVLPVERTLQLGGKATTGHGFCRIIPLS